MDDELIVIKEEDEDKKEEEPSQEDEDKDGPTDAEDTGEKNVVGYRYQILTLT